MNKRTRDNRIEWWQKGTQNTLVRIAKKGTIGLYMRTDCPVRRQVECTYFLRKCLHEGSTGKKAERTLRVPRLCMVNAWRGKSSTVLYYYIQHWGEWKADDGRSKKGLLPFPEREKEKERKDHQREKEKEKERQAKKEEEWNGSEGNQATRRGNVALLPSSFHPSSLAIRVEKRTHSPSYSLSSRRRSGTRSTSSIA